MKTKRLDRADIERRINEMFDALEGCPAEDLTEVHEQADQIARRMRAAVDAQDRLDAAAPALLASCKWAVANLSCKWGDRDHVIQMKSAIHLAETGKELEPDPEDLAPRVDQAPPPAVVLGAGDRHWEGCKMAAKKIVLLCADPQPGLLTWIEAMSAAFQDLEATLAGRTRHD